ncbi:MAG: hypothetical protein AAB655_01080 [Patescibacteria group bacterium]
MEDFRSYAAGGREKKRRRQAYLVVFSVLSLALLVFIAASWIFLKSPLFTVKRITVSGNGITPEKDILDLLRSKIGNGNLFLAMAGLNNVLAWPSAVEKSDLRFLSSLSELSVKKDYGKGTVNVTVKERDRYGVWCGVSAGGNDPADCRWFDENGVVFERAPFAEGSLITSVLDYSGKKMTASSLILPERMLSNALSVFEVLKKSGLRIKGISIKDISLEELEVSTYDGPVAYFSLRFPADNALPVIQNFASKSGFKDLEYLDFRVENRAYYK